MGTFAPSAASRTIRAAAKLLRSKRAALSASIGFTILQSASVLWAAAARPATPWCSPSAGTYTYGLSVKIADATEGTTIYYTTDGSTPTIQSHLYTGPISIPSSPATETINAIAVANGVTSWMTSAVYVIAPQLAPPSFSPAPGSYTGTQTIKISSPTPGGVIHYTTDGTAPTSSSPLYTNPITASQTLSILAVVTGVSGYSASGTVRANYTITQPAPTPVILPSAGTFSTPPAISISNSLKSASIYYTLDGTVPTPTSTFYDSPFTLSASVTGPLTIKAIAAASGYAPSAIATTTLVLALPTGDIATAAIGTTPGVSIAPDFLGVSHEWNTAQLMIGSKSSGVNPLYTTLLSQLTKNMNGPLIVRVGGSSTDTTGPANEDTVEPFIELAGQMPVKFILGVNLGAGNLSLAEEQAATFVANMPATNLEAVEIGNEPDGYASNGLRPSTYSFSEFLPQYQQWRAGILGQNTVGIAGPVFGTGNWDLSAGSALVNGTLEASIVTQHEYLVCYDPDNPEPGDFLLQPASSMIHFYSLIPFVTQAHAVNLPLRVAEMNSICSGGQPGLSDSFSSALWAIDAMFEYANAGIEGVNWNTSYDGGPYDLFQFHVWQKNSLNQYTLGTVRPLFYGLLFFSRAAGNNSKLLPVSLLTNYNLKVWATIDSTGKAHITILNKEQSAAGSVQFPLAGFSSGTVTTLADAGGYLATTGVTFGGQTFDNSVNGTLTGTLATEALKPVGDVWTVAIQPMSAVLVDLEP